jgi:hypothetical protein
MKIMGQKLYCKVKDQGFECDLDADGEGIRLSPAGASLGPKIVGVRGRGNAITVERRRGLWRNLAARAATIKG